MMPALFAGCCEDFTPDIDTKPVLCINSLITAGRPVEVEVTRSWAYGDLNAYHNHRVDDALVSVYTNGQPVDKDYLPAEGDHLRIVAESKLYGRAEAEVEVPHKVPVGKVTWTTEVTYSQKSEFPNATYYSYNLNLDVKMDVDDPADISNYYIFSYSVYPDDETIGHDSNPVPQVKIYPGTFHYEREPVFSEHIGIFDAITGSDSDGFTFFTDRHFSGKTCTLDLLFSNVGIEMTIPSAPGDNPIPDCGLVLSLSSISPSYYNWCNYKWNVVSGTINDLSQIGLGEPIWGYSNVSTGAGVVASYSQSDCYVNLKRLLQESRSGIVDTGTVGFVSGYE